ncbi:hypothetical protein BD324DRAFT_642970 [Kockovaella imperatae]|uniref:PhyH-domain-containing protein n=1 Tax=Kockovaella imperatae TaxID=4999 RepID=A0A1Y1UB71_9TREE|nr:hypothetical protein BD324DRAFT_642970 [Kockovaella imperatae]ORX35288.1 hypothetical protein BD324DRAFT_642970 [Kockovaella imperatae]
MYKLDSTQIEQYHRDGFLILRASEHGLLPDVTALPSWTDEVRHWPLSESHGKWMPYMEDTTNGKQIMRTEKFKDYHQGFESLLDGEALRAILSQLGGQSMILFKDKINYKLPGGNGFAAHLDAPAYDHICKVEHVTANIAIHPADAANGCLEVVPGSHKMAVDFIAGGHITDEWCDAHEWVSVPLEVGDMLIFGSHLAHRSGPNTSQRERAMLYATYSAESDGKDLREKYYAHRREAFPPDHERKADVDYSEGYKTYGFAAPFSRPTAVKV